MANKKNLFQKASRKKGRRSLNPIEEKGTEFFSEDGDFDETIAEIIRHYKWEIFVHPPRYFCLELVLEFYRNLNQETNESAVMGRRISFSPETINHIFGLESVNNELTPTPDWEEVEGKLCLFGANWVLKPNGERNYLIGTLTFTEADHGCDETDGPRRESGQTGRPRQVYLNAQRILMRQLIQQMVQLAVKHDKADENRAEMMSRMQETMERKFRRGSPNKRIFF